LGSGLSVIKFLSENLNHQTPENISQENIKKISESSKDLLDKMSDIVWATDPANDTLGAFLVQIYNYAYEYLDTHQIDCQILRPKEVPNIELSGEKRRNLLLVIKEILHNIVKHSNATKTEIHIQLSPKQLDILVNDNGIGFDVNQAKGTGNGINNMKTRMEKIEGHIQFLDEDNGASIQIELPLASTKVI